MLVDLSERVAIVTGSTRGIGLATAKRLALSGANVVINARQDDVHLAEAAELLRADAKSQILPIAADVGSAQGAASLVKTAFDAFRRIDVLVNNAGILKEAPIGMIGSDDIKSLIDANLGSVLNMTQAVSRVMARRKAGAIVNLTSIMGRRGRAGQFVYSATKAGVIGATLAAAKELSKSGIRVNAVAPGYIETSMTQHVTDVQKTALTSNIPAGRAGTPDDVAAAICFLVSDFAQYITGQVLGVDGGMIA
jgi:3-oxoacyl-[acyl-carrier protein] reductase